MFSKAYKNITHLSLKKLDVTVAKLRIPALNAELTVFAMMKQIIQVSSPAPPLNVVGQSGLMLLTFITTHVFQVRFAELSIIGTQVG